MLILTQKKILVNACDELGVPIEGANAALAEKVKKRGKRKKKKEALFFLSLTKMSKIQV